MMWVARWREAHEVVVRAVMEGRDGMFLPSLVRCVWSVVRYTGNPL